MKGPSWSPYSNFALICTLISLFVFFFYLKWLFLVRAICQRNSASVHRTVMRNTVFWTATTSLALVWLTFILIRNGLLLQMTGVEHLKIHLLVATQWMAEIWRIDWDKLLKIFVNSSTACSYESHKKSYLHIVPVHVWFK